MPDKTWDWVCGMIICLDVQPLLGRQNLSSLGVGSWVVWPCSIEQLHTDACMREVEISGFFGDSASCDGFLEAILWEDVVLKQTLERTQRNVWKEFKYNPTDKRTMLLHWFALQFFDGICWIFLVLTLWWEMCQGTHMAASYRFCGLLLTQQGLMVKLLLLIHVWCFGLDCWYPNNNIWNCPKVLVLNRSTSPFPINLSLHLPLLGRLEGRLKYLRTLIKEGFEKALHTESLRDSAREHWLCNPHLQKLPGTLVQAFLT